MRIENGLGADQLIAHVTSQELDEIYETMMSAIKWRHANNEEHVKSLKILWMQVSITFDLLLLIRGVYFVYSFIISLI